MATNYTVYFEYDEVEDYCGPHALTTHDKDFLTLPFDLNRCLVTQIKKYYEENKKYNYCNFKVLLVLEEIKIISKFKTVK